MDTDALIAQLARQAKPVRRLAPPCCRAERWFALSTVAVALVAVAMGLRSDLAAKFASPWFVFQVLAALATAACAIFAASSATVPGEPRWVVWSPSLPMAAWAGSLGLQWWDEWPRDTVGLDLVCLPAVALLGLVPALVMVATVREGALFQARTSLALGTLASAALAAAGLRLVHPQDAAAMVLLWQVGTVALYSVIAALAAPKILARRPSR